MYFSAVMALTAMMLPDVWLPPGMLLTIAQWLFGMATISSGLIIFSIGVVVGATVQDIISESAAVMAGR